jgi:murein DD-endopeptidase MepM/ murein hydrolase activator NlpD
MLKTIRLLLIIAALGATAARAQEKTEPPPPEQGWKHSLVSGLSLTQVSYKNWSKGGENSLAYTLSLDGKSTLTDGMVLWENQYRLAYGQARLGDKDLRKTDDVIDLASVFTYVIAEHLNPYASATFKSQFTTGYKYDDNDVATAVSKFFDPAYFTQAVGIRYQPVAEVRTRLGLGLREVITDEYSSFNYADDPKTGEIEKTSVNGGLESVTDIEWVVMENVLLTSQLAVFEPFSDTKHPIVNNKNKLTGKVNSYITAMFEFELVYDDVVSPQVQLREGISLGLSYNLF